MVEKNTILSRFEEWFCICPEWERTQLQRHTRLERGEALKYYPGQCPYCHEPLETRIEYMGVWVGEGITITLQELKALLEVT